MSLLLDCITHIISIVIQSNIQEYTMIKNTVSFSIFVVVAYEFIMAVLTLFDGMNKCGIFEVCK